MLEYTEKKTAKLIDTSQKVYDIAFVSHHSLRTVSKTIAYLNSWYL